MGNVSAWCAHWRSGHSQEVVNHALCDTPILMCCCHVFGSEKGKHESNGELSLYTILVNYCSKKSFKVL